MLVLLEQSKTCALMFRLKDNLLRNPEPDPRIFASGWETSLKFILYSAACVKKVV
jgi:hypothetical protein